MPARTGAQYLDGLREGREIWLEGERVEVVTTDPRLARGSETQGVPLPAAAPSWWDVPSPVR